MSLSELMIDIPTQHEQNVFGQFDAYAKKIERTFHVTLIARDGQVKILGEQASAEKARRVLTQLTELSRRGNTITEQNVDYAISLVFEDQEEGIVEIDRELICHTLQGKPIKPKTLGQKKYVDAIKKDMITFGLGPAGTGKTYLAMAMAITAFKQNEVERIILTRPAIEAGEKLGFLPGDLQSKIDPYLRPLYDALYQIMGAACLYARKNAGQCIYHTGRGAEYDACSDENVPDKDRFRIQSRDHRRFHAERSSGRNGFRSGCGSESDQRSGGDQHLHADEQRCCKTPTRTEDRKSI